MVMVTVSATMAVTTTTHTEEVMMATILAWSAAPSDDIPAQARDGSVMVTV